MSKLSILAAVATVAVFAASQAAEASQMAGFNFYGPGISGSVNFTIEPDVSPPDPNSACGTTGTCRSDPLGAYRITDVTGVFSDSNNGLNIVSAAITGLVPISPADERDPTFDPLVPSSLSFLASGLSYNNLYFPDGSPIDCAYPFFGTFLDVFGTAFSVVGGDIVDLWGDGNELPDGSLTYGVAVANGATVLDDQFDGISAAVPEPFTLSIFGAGLFGVAAMRRRRAESA